MSKPISITTCKAQATGNFLVALAGGFTACQQLSVTLMSYRVSGKNRLPPIVVAIVVLCHDLRRRGAGERNPALHLRGAHSGHRNRARPRMVDPDRAPAPDLRLPEHPGDRGRGRPFRFRRGRRHRNHHRLLDLCGHVFARSGHQTQRHRARVPQRSRAFAGRDRGLERARRRDSGPAAARLHLLWDGGRDVSRGQKLG